MQVCDGSEGNQSLQVRVCRGGMGNWGSKINKSLQRGGEGNWGLQRGSRGIIRICKGVQELGFAKGAGGVRVCKSGFAEGAWGTGVCKGVQGELGFANQGLQIRVCRRGEGNWGLQRG